MKEYLLGAGLAAGTLQSVDPQIDDIADLIADFGRLLDPELKTPGNRSRAKPIYCISSHEVRPRRRTNSLVRRQLC
jgi:hypothetical protein